MAWFSRKPSPDDATPWPDEWFAGPYERERRRMLEKDLRPRGIRDMNVLRAMARAPRHEFVDSADQSVAYDDGPLPIGYGQTISQPYMVACMTELALGNRGKKDSGGKPDARVLEIGIGCGYQTAVLLEAGATVIGLELVGELTERANATLRRLGYTGFELHTADGRHGWPTSAPYEAIILAAAPRELPPDLASQVAEGGRIVAPLGPSDDQRLFVFEKRAGALHRIEHFPVRFVPMVSKESYNGQKKSG